MLLFILMLPCCKKKEKNIQWLEQNSTTSLNLNSVHFIDDQNGYVVGGKTWTDGVYLQTEDAGVTWVADTLGEKELFTVTFDQNNKGYTIGIDGNFFKRVPENSWEFWRHQHWFIMRDAAFWNAQNGVIVGGEAFQFGKIMKMEDTYDLKLIDTIDQELSAVFYSDENTVHICGFGTVMRSTDAGYNYSLVDISGDFFQDIHFPSPTVGYIVGSGGTIIKTTDSGQNYKFLREGDKLFVSDEAFRAVHFVNEELGYIVGDDGIFWKTENGGDDWKVVDGFPGENLNDIFVVNGTGYIVGDKGKIYQFFD